MNREQRNLHLKQKAINHLKTLSKSLEMVANKNEDERKIKNPGKDPEDWLTRDFINEVNWIIELVSMIEIEEQKKEEKRMFKNFIETIKERMEQKRKKFREAAFNNLVKELESQGYMVIPKEEYEKLAKSEDSSIETLDEIYSKNLADIFENFMHS